MASISPIIPLISKNTKFQPIFVNDVVSAIIKLIINKDIKGNIFDLGGKFAYTFENLLKILLDIKRIKRFLFPLNPNLMMIPALFLERLPKPPFTVDQMKLLKHDNILNGNSPGLNELGIEPADMEEELTKIYSPQAPFIFTSTNKVYGDNPNRLKLIEKNSRFEIPKKNKYYKGINEKFSIDSCTHSFFGVSKTYADLIVQEYGKNIGLKTVSFRGGCITGPNHNGAKLHGFLSYLVKQCLNKKTYDIIGYKGKQVRDNIHSQDLVNCFWEFYKKPKYGEVYNIGGGRKSNCSIIEAIDIVEKKSWYKCKTSRRKWSGCLYCGIKKENLC